MHTYMRTYVSVTLRNVEMSRSRMLAILHMHDGVFVYVSYHGAGGRPSELERGRQRE